MRDIINEPHITRDAFQHMIDCAPTAGTLTYVKAFSAPLWSIEAGLYDSAQYDVSRGTPVLVLGNASREWTWYVNVLIEGNVYIMDSTQLEPVDE